MRDFSSCSRMCTNGISHYIAVLVQIIVGYLEKSFHKKAQIWDFKQETDVVILKSKMW